MIILLLFLLGLAIGSFANVLIDRLPRGESVLLGRSKCDHCRKTLSWFELVPVVSFLVQGGTCRHCKKPITLRYPLVELVSGIGLVYAFELSHQSLGLFLSSSLLFFSCLVIIVTDLHYQIIPDSMVVLVLASAILRSLAVGGTESLFSLGSLMSSFFISAFFFSLWFVTRGHGMGLGDAKLAFVLSLFLGFPSNLIMVYGAFLTGGITGVILLLGGKKTLKSRIPFGPFLVLGFVVSFWRGLSIYNWWAGIV